MRAKVRVGAVKHRVRWSDRGGRRAAACGVQRDVEKKFCLHLGSRDLMSMLKLYPDKRLRTTSELFCSSVTDAWN